jgi:tight adherence protein B
VTGLLAFAAGVAAVGAVVSLAPGTLGSGVSSFARLVGACSGALDALLRLGREGREPGAVERRRLLAGGALAALAGGSLLLGPLAGPAVALAAPTAIGRLLRARRVAYRRAVTADAPAIALAVADALSGGHSLRGALSEAAAGLSGAGGAELRRLAAELAAGSPTEEVLERLRGRVLSPPVDAIVAACLLQRRSGGDLGRLLRSLARAFEDQQRVEEEVRTATAQARFTGMLVVVASPGFVSGMAGSLLTAWLVGVAVVLQVAAALLIRQLGKTRA